MADSNNIFAVGTNLDLSGFRAGIAQLRQELSQLQKDIESNKPTVVDPRAMSQLQGTTLSSSQQLEVLKNNYSKAGATGTDATQKVTKNVQQLNNTLGETARRVFVWGALSAAIFGTISSIKEAYDQTIKLNTAMAELAKVLPREANLGKIRNQGFELAITFGRNPDEVFDILAKFAQAGLNADESFKAAKSALVALNVTGAETEDVINAIIASSRVFKIEWENMASVIDKIQRVQAKFAVSSKDLIASIAAIGPAVEGVGGNLDDLFGAIAGMGEAARVSGKEASNSLKTIFARLGTPESMRLLEDMGVAVRSTADSFRPISNIMRDIAAAYNTASEAEKQNMAVVLAGIRQYSKLGSLLLNYENAQKALAESQKSFGEGMAANDIMMATFERRLASVSASIQKSQISLVEKTGAPEGVLALKESFDLLLKVLNFVPGSLLSIGTALGIFMVSLSAARSLMVGFKDSTRMAFASVNTAQLLYDPMEAARRAKLDPQKVTGGFNVTFGKGETASTKFFSNSVLWAGKLVTALGGLVSIIYLVGVAIEAWSHKNIVFEQLNKRVDQFKESLAALDFNNIVKTDTEQKYNSIVSILEGLAAKSEIASVSVHDFARAFDGVVKGVNSTNLDIGGIEKLQTVLTQFKDYFESQFYQPFNTRIADLNKNVATGLEAIAANIKKFGSRGARITTFDILTESMADQNYELVGFWQNLGEKFIGTSREANNAANAFSVLIEKTQEMVDAAALLSTSSGKSFNFEEFLKTSDGGQVDKNMQHMIEQMFELYQVRKMINMTAKEQGVVLDQGELKTSVDLTETLNKRFKEYVKNMVTLAMAGQPIEKITKMLMSLDEQMQKDIDTTKAFAVEIRASSVTTALKKTISSVIAGHEAEIDAISRVAKATKAAGITYDEYDEKVKRTENTIKAIIELQKSNANTVSDLKMQQRELNAALGQKKVGDGGIEIFTGTQSITDIENKLRDIRTELLTLEEVNKRNNSTIDQGLLILEKQKKAYEAIASVPKQVSKGLEDQLKLLEEITSTTAKFNTALGQDPSVAFERNEEIYKQLLDSQKQYALTELSIGNISQDVANKKLQELDTQYEIAKAARFQALILTEVEARYKNLINLSEKYADANSTIRLKLAQAASELDKLGKVRGRDNVLSAELESLNEQRKIELEITRQKMETVGTAEYLIRAAETEISLRYSVVEAEAAINDIVEKRRKHYEEVNQIVQDIQGSVVSWLTDQNALLDDLASKGSGLKILGRLSKGVFDAVAKADAQVIANAISKPLQQYAETLKGSVQEGAKEGAADISEMIKMKLDETTLPNQLEDKITSASNSLITGSYDSIVKAWQTVASTIFPQLNKAIIDGFKGNIFNVPQPDIDTNALRQSASSDASVMSVALLLQQKALQEQLDKEKQKAATLSTQIADAQKFKFTDSPFMSAGVDDLPSKTSGPIVEAQERTTQDLIAEYRRVADKIDELNRTIQAVGAQVDGALKITNVTAQSQLPLMGDIAGAVFNQEDIQRAAKTQAEKDAAALRKATLESAGRMAINMAGTALSGSIAKNRGTNQEFVGNASNVGFMAGSMLFPGNPFAGAAASSIFGIISAALGPTEEDKKQTDNLVDINNNTAMLVDRLSPEIINAPSTFSIPAGTGYGSVSIQNTIYVGGSGLSTSQANSLTSQLNDLYSRSTKRTTLIG